MNARILISVLGAAFFAASATAQESNRPVSATGTVSVAGAEERCISVEQYRDKMAAGWIGQMAGVGRGGPTEWWAHGEILAEELVPKWKPGKINQFNQDDIYVEMTFLRTLEEHGFGVSIRHV